MPNFAKIVIMLACLSSPNTTAAMDQRIDGAIPSQIAVHLGPTVSSVQSNLQSAFGVSLSSHTFIASLSADFAYKQLATAINFKESFGSFAAFYNSICSSHYGYTSGFFLPKAIVVCIDAIRLRKYDNSAALSAVHEAIWREAAFTIRHEMFHAVQYEWMNKPDHLALESRYSDFWGPVWLLEGAAIWYGLAGSGSKLSRQAIPGYYEASAQFARNQLVDMTLLEMPSAHTQHPSALHRQGGLATYMLIERHGIESIKTFYIEVGETKDWKTAFGRAFRMPVEDFYNQFYSSLEW